MKRIAIEEHFFTEEYLKYLRSRKDYPRLETSKSRTVRWSGCGWPVVLCPQCSLTERLLDVGEGRLKSWTRWVLIYRCFL